MRRELLAIVLLFLGLGATTWAQSEGGGAQADTRAVERPWEVIEMAIALDTSASMEALIDSVRLTLWDIVHDLARLDPAPVLRVALLSYGNWKAGASAGWVRIETDLTSNLDLVSELLFGLTDEGFQGPDPEYVGRVLQAALTELSWAQSPEVLKMVFVAGNERANQDPVVSFRDMSDLARQQDIGLYAVYCGHPDNPGADTWKEMADLAQGQFAAINHQAGSAVLKSPFDAKLEELSAEINKTFIPLGKEGQKRLDNITEQDENARKLSPATAASRAQVKSSPMYSAGWDLVDALEAGTSDLYALDDSQLPESLQALSLGEREAYVEEMSLERQALREQIAELADKRRAYEAEQRKAKGLNKYLAFDTVVRQAIREAAEEKGFHHPDSER